VGAPVRPHMPKSASESATMIDWMKSNDVEYEHIKKRAMPEKTVIIVALDLPEQEKHSTEMLSFTKHNQ